MSPREMLIEEPFDILFQRFVANVAPSLDVYEVAIFLYLLAESMRQGDLELVVSFRAARLRMPLGGGDTARISPSNLQKKTRSLERRGLLTLLGPEHKGTRVRLSTSSVWAPHLSDVPADELPVTDFYRDPRGRSAIVQREGNKCFYCGADLTQANTVLDHLKAQSVAEDNSWRNVVASCRGCNGRKRTKDPESFLRVLYREGFLSAAEFTSKRSRLAEIATSVIPQ